MITPIENGVIKLFSSLHDSVPEHDIWKVRERFHTFHALVRPGPDKQCSCGRTYNIENWYDLPLVGYQTHAVVGGEMRNCPCSSTILLVGRRGKLIRPQSNLFLNTIIDPLSRNIRPPFTLTECMNITEAFTTCVPQYLSSIGKTAKCWRLPTKESLPLGM